LVFPLIFLLAFPPFPLTLSWPRRKQNARFEARHSPGFEGFFWGWGVCPPPPETPLKNPPSSQAASHHLFAYALTYLPKPAERVIKFKIFKHILRVGQKKKIDEGMEKRKSHKKRTIDQMGGK